MNVCVVTVTVTVTVTGSQKRWFLKVTLKFQKQVFDVTDWRKQVSLTS